jgi:hypothetical protein
LHPGQVKYRVEAATKVHLAGFVMTRSLESPERSNAVSQKTIQTI